MPTWALKSLLFQLTSRALTDRTPLLLRSQVPSPGARNWTWLEAKSFNSGRENWVLPSLLPPINLYSLPLDKELVGWEAQGSREAQCLILFPTPSSLGPPNRPLSLATGSRSLPASGCGIHPLLGFPQGPFPMGCKLRNWRGCHSLDPSQAKGPQEGSQARARRADPRAGMTDAGILLGHLGPMNPPGEEQDEKDRPPLESRPGLSLSTAKSFVFLLLLFLFFLRGSKENE